MYVDDFKQCRNCSASVSFADDTNIFVIWNNVNSICSKANQELENINAWMVADKLSLNIN